MTNQTWKPGDLAIRDETHLRPTERIHFRTEAGWIDCEGDRRIVTDDTMSRAARQLLVIDPHDIPHTSEFDPDPAAALRLMAEGCDDNDLDASAAVLRWIAHQMDHKPAEPTGIGAVAVDRDARRWVLADPEDGDDERWYCPAIQEWLAWSRINAVEIVSEGVVAS